MTVAHQPATRRPAPDNDRTLHRGLYAVTAFLLIEPLFLVALIAVAVRQPDYLWYALGPYLVVTAGFVTGIAVLLRRAGMLRLGVLGPALLCVGATIAAATAVLIGAIWLFESLAWLWTLIYLVGLAYVVVWFVRWQAANFALRCDACTHTFTATPGQWALSMNMGDRKHIRCPACAQHWAQIVRREAAA